MARIELQEDAVEQIAGGNVTFTPSSVGSPSGKIGLNGREHYTYSNEEDVIAFISEHAGDKTFKNVHEQDKYLIKGLLEAGLIK